MTAVGGGVMTWRNWSGPTAFDADTSRTFGLVVGIEVALAAIGAAVLARRRVLLAVAGQRPPLAVTSGGWVLDTLEHMFEHRPHGGHWRWS